MSSIQSLADVVEALHYAMINPEGLPSAVHDALEEARMFLIDLQKAQNAESS